MARSRRQSDNTYNVRRRLLRQADRELKQAEKTSGAASARHQEIAQRALQRAVNTYAGAPTGKAEKLMARLGKKIEKQPGANMQKIEEKAEAGKFRVRRAAREQQQATEILNSSIGSRIVGAFESVWRDKEGNPIDAIKDYMGVSSDYELLLKVEEITGESLYAEPGNEIRYDEVTGLIRASLNL